MSSRNTMSSVAFALVSLFAFGCGQPEALKSEAVLGTSTQSLESCNDESAFDLSGLIRVLGRLPAAMACADFNGDGLADLAVADPESGSVSVLMNEGDGTLGTPVVFVTGGGSGVITQDLDGDGQVDLLVTNDADGSVSVLRGFGPGGFAPRITFASLPSAEELAASFASQLE